MLSRKYYNMLAKIIKESQSKTELIRNLCVALRDDNHNFDSYRFEQASKESEVVQW